MSGAGATRPRTMKCSNQPPHADVGRTLWRVPPSSVLRARATGVRGALELGPTTSEPGCGQYRLLLPTTNHRVAPVRPGMLATDRVVAFLNSRPRRAGQLGV